MAKHALFVTGTDTEVGKTTVSVALLDWARKQGLKTIALKPVAAGCELKNGRWQNDDALHLQAAATMPLDYAEVNPIALPDAIAPHIAAELNQVSMDADAIAAHCAKYLRRENDFLLIEGAGGWLVPLNDHETFADVPRILQVPVLLVVAIRLGCLNHALLSAAAIANSGLKLAAWVANCVEPENEFTQTNIETLQQRLKAPCIGIVPYQLSPEPSNRSNLDQFLNPEKLFS